MKLAQYLRTLARQGQYGRTRNPSDYFMSGDYCDFYWHNHGVVPNHATWQLVADLSARYRRFIHFMTEVAPQWVEVQRIHYADNSVVSVQQNFAGDCRRVMVTAPSGDICF